MSSTVATPRIGGGDCTANRYTYVNGDPINHHDPTGHCSQQVIEISRVINEVSDGSAEWLIEMMEQCQTALLRAQTPLETDREWLADTEIKIAGEGDAVYSFSGLDLVMVDIPQQCFDDFVCFQRYTALMRGLGLWDGPQQGGDALPAASSSTLGVVHGGRVEIMDAVEVICSAGRTIGYGDIARGVQDDLAGDEDSARQKLQKGAWINVGAYGISGASAAGEYAANKAGSFAMAARFGMLGKFLAFKVTLVATAVDFACSRS